MIISRTERQIAYSHLSQIHKKIIEKAVQHGMKLKGLWTYFETSTEMSLVTHAKEFK